MRRLSNEVHLRVPVGTLRKIGLRSDRPVRCQAAAGSPCNESIHLGLPQSAMPQLNQGASLGLCRE